MAQTAPNDSCEETNSNDCSSSAALNPIVKIKQEKIDIEIENKIELLKANIKTEPSENGISLGESNGHTINKDSQEESEDDDSNDSDSSSQEEDDEDEQNSKKNIEPVKSSNEILTELFHVFNVAPPEELLDDKNLIKKAKKHKKEKKKKHKKHKTDGAALSLEESDGKHKKKKKHKHKHKDGSKDKKDKARSKDKERDKSKDKEKSKLDKKKIEPDKIREGDRGRERTKSAEKSKSKEEEKKLLASLEKHERVTKSSTERKRHHDKEDQISDSSAKRHKIEDKGGRINSFYNGFKEREHSRERNENKKIKTEPRERKSRRHSEDGKISDISLSDEETYLKGKETRSDNSKKTNLNSFYDGAKRSRSRDKERDRCHSREHYRERDRDRNRDRDNWYHNRGFSRRYHSRYSRSRSRSRSRDLGIDKKRLLEIARKNAISMFKRGNLPGCDNMSQEIKDKVLLKMRYGGRTVEDLTEFCKKISNGENLSDLSSDEDSDVDKAGNSKAFHHPFQLKEREPIVMHIRNSKPILPVLSKTEEQTKAITMQFPVSSGQQHRMTEHWVPVETKESLPALPALPAATQSTTIFKGTTPKNALGKPLPLAVEQEPAFKAVPAPPPNNETSTEVPAAGSPSADSSCNVVTETPTPVVAPAPTQVTPSIATTANPPNLTPNPAFVPDVPVPSTNNSIFPQMNSAALDVSSIISKRLNAMRRLQENPMDSEAIKMMYNSQKEMSSWASSKHIPGQFTGSTGVNVLKPNELNSGPQVWARRDQLTSTKPVTGGMGMHLLQKMGWRPGEGLGREKNGSLQPLLLDVKLDKRGLVASEDCNRKGVAIKRRVGHTTLAVQQNIEEKHPVCLLNELTSKRKWNPPMYNLVNEKGPSHSKMFLFSVQVNGETFTPDKACNTKKEAKMVAAKHCLQRIGILPSC